MDIDESVSITGRHRAEYHQLSNRVFFTIYRVTGAVPGRTARHHHGTADDNRDMAVSS